MLQLPAIKEKCAFHVLRGLERTIFEGAVREVQDSSWENAVLKDDILPKDAHGWENALLEARHPTQDAREILDAAGEHQRLMVGVVLERVLNGNEVRYWVERHF